jgi:hypothetical protein
MNQETTKPGMQLSHIGDVDPNVDTPGLHDQLPNGESLRSLANLLVCTSTELAFTQLPSYTAKVDRFVKLIRDALTESA